MSSQPEPIDSTQLPEPEQPPKQARNPLHGITLETIVAELEAHYGWPGLAQRINIRCFASEPSISSSLKFLRKTPWARKKVESLYLYMLRKQNQKNQPLQKKQRKYGYE